MSEQCDLCDAPSNLHNCQLPDEHTLGCPNERRVPVQGDGPNNLPEAHPARRAWVERYGHPPWPPGTIAWSEHLLAHAAYEQQYGTCHQSAERIAERGGFSRLEAEELLGRPLSTWRRR